MVIIVALCFFAALATGHRNRAIWAMFAIVAILCVVSWQDLHHWSGFKGEFGWAVATWGAATLVGCAIGEAFRRTKVPDPPRVV